MVLQAHERGEEASREVAGLLGISRQTRHNWLKPESVEWQQVWAERLAGARDKGAPPSLVRRKLSDADWEWIAGVLTTCGARTWNLKRAAIEREAVRENSGMAHLRGIHRVLHWQLTRERTHQMAKLERTHQVSSSANGWDDRQEP